jgi:hypothetical protein
MQAYEMSLRSRILVFIKEMKGRRGINFKLILIIFIYSFICLGLRDPQTGWPCGSYNSVCNIAPVQTIITSSFHTRVKRFSDMELNNSEGFRSNR